MRLLVLGVALSIAVNAWRSPLDRRADGWSVKPSHRWLVDHDSFEHNKSPTRKLRAGWMAHVQHTAEDTFSILQGLTVPGVHEDGMSSCYQCTTSCHTPACRSCYNHTRIAPKDIPGPFCEDLVGQPAPSVLDHACMNCSCCHRVARAHCDSSSGVCQQNPGLPVCEAAGLRLGDILNAPRCSRLLRDLIHHNFTGVCSDPCFPEYMDEYRVLYETRCLNHVSLQPDQFQAIMCGGSCVPSMECLQLSSEFAAAFDQNKSCSVLRTALSRGRLSSAMCSGDCLATYLASYRELVTKDCFLCEADVVTGDDLEAALCAGDTNKAPVVNDAVFDECLHLVDTRLNTFNLNRDCESVVMAFAHDNFDGICNSPCFNNYISVYTELYEHSCMIDEASLIPSDFERLVCSLDKTTPSFPISVVSPDSPVAILRTTLSLPLSISPVAFSSHLLHAFISSVARSAGVNSDEVRILGVSSGSIVVAFEVVVIDTTAGQNTLSHLSEDLVGDAFKADLNNRFHAVDETVTIDQVTVIEPLSMEVVAECEEPRQAVAAFCYDDAGCPDQNLSVDCCLSLVESIHSGCASDPVCGTSLRETFDRECSGLTQTLTKLDIYYDDHRSKSPSHSPSISPSPAPSSSLSASLSVSSSASPRNVFVPVRQRQYNFGSFMPPELPFTYWGVRQHCVQDDEEMQCVCAYGYTGPYCEKHIFETCPRQCNDHGMNCTSGECQCEHGITGEACTEVVGCSGGLNFCSGHGSCHCNRTACQCHCARGFSGRDCSVADHHCKNQCSNHGMCDVSGNCTCSPGWTGRDCSLPAHSKCPFNCSGHGQCDPATSQCDCHRAFTGVGCQLADPVEQATICGSCNGKGLCDIESGTCKCKPGYFGEHCEFTEYQHDCSSLDFCSGHGVCRMTENICDCEPGYHGTTCNRIDGCVNDCSGHGSCRGTPANATCKCRIGWEGGDCSVSKCPVDSDGRMCSHAGICESRHGVFRCTCGVGVEGAACENVATGFEGSFDRGTPTPTPTATPVPCGGNNCSERGVCTEEGICDCLQGYSGEDCSQDVEPVTPGEF